MEEEEGARTELQLVTYSLEGLSLICLQPKHANAPSMTSLINIFGSCATVTIEPTCMHAN